MDQLIEVFWKILGSPETQKVIFLDDDYQEAVRIEEKLECKQATQAGEFFSRWSQQWTSSKQILH